MSDGCKSGYSGGDRFGVHGDSHYCCRESEAEGKAGNEPKGHVVSAPGKANATHDEQDGDWGDNDVDKPKIDMDCRDQRDQAPTSPLTRSV